VEFIRANNEQPKTYVASQRLFLTRDRSRVVEESSPDAAFLLVPEGGLLSEAEARRYGLLNQKAIVGPPLNKAVLSAPENKRKSNK